MAKKPTVLAGPPLNLLISETERERMYRDPGMSRYTRLPNPDLAHNISVSRGSVVLREPRIDEGVSFCEPMAGQGFNDQFPWR